MPITYVKKVTDRSISAMKTKMTLLNNRKSNTRLHNNKKKRLNKTPLNSRTCSTKYMLFYIFITDTTDVFINSCINC